MNNRKRFLLLNLVMIFCILLSGCTAKLSETEAFDLLTQAIDASLDAEVYYWKELDIRNPENKISASTNVHCKVDEIKYEYMKDESGEYVDKRVNVIESVNSKTTNQIFCGIPTKGTESLYVKIPYDNEGNKLKNQDGKGQNTVVTMPVNEFLASEEFVPYKLSEKLKPLLELTVEDLEVIDEDKQEQSGHLVKLTYRVKDSFFAEHPDSILKGSKLQIELAYGKVASFTVYENFDYGDNLKLDEEIYNLKIVYLGPKFDVPNVEE